uniref:Nibrin n=1 Tax=Stegastes partitus TaxID=144197 RepID=A0A3B4ZA70_9TELE
NRSCVFVMNLGSVSRTYTVYIVCVLLSLILKDTSKYGTFVNGERLTAPVNIKSGDEVTFGVFHSKFRFKPMVCSSCLDNEGKTSLSQALQALGGSLVNTWTEDCTHLVMPSIKVTIKTISALLCCRPIVKPEFFSELNNAVQQKLPPPKAESFTPEIDEPSLNKEDVNLGVIPLRKRLFTGKTFVFLSAKQLKRLSAAVKFGGGRSQLLEEGSLLRNLLESPQSCVVDVTTGSSQALLPPSSAEWANSSLSGHRKGLRVITESEIGLAAIYASCDMYCNSSSLMIPSASLSQSATVDESVLPAASQNITAYAANTETSQRYRQTLTHESPIFTHFSVSSRPLEDDFLSDVMSEPKRPVLEPPATFQKPNTATEIPSLPLRGVSETPPESESDLFTSRPDERQNRKRKEMEEEIQMEELESIMSEGMDCFDEQLSDDQTHSSAKQKQGLSTEEASSKRQRLQRKENETTKRQSGQVGLEKTSSLHHNQGSEQHVVTVKTEPVDPTDYRTTTEEFRKPAEKPTARKNIKPFEDDDVEVRKRDLLQTFKTEIKISSNCVSLLLLSFHLFSFPVGFRNTFSIFKINCQPQSTSVCLFTFSFPHEFYQNRVPGADGFQHVIGGSDLLVHNKGKNTDLDEWLKDEERQSRREEAAGDDLFR